MPRRQAVHSVSVVIPVRNEALSLPALFESLAHQTFAPSEIVLVDGGSTDGTADRVRAMAEAEPRIRLIEAGPATPGRGRNVGITAVRHEWVALTDAGAWVEPTWLEELVTAARREPHVSVVYGNYEPVTDTFFTRCAALAYVAPKNAAARGSLRGPSTISMLLTREVWELVGGFPDLRAGEDLIFMERVADLGVHIAWAPAATVWWQLQPSLVSTFRRFITYSRHNVRAGLQRRWHYRLARQYVIATVFVVLAGVYDWRWLLALPAGLALRTAKSVWHRRGLNGLGWRAVNPAQFFGVLGILLAVDAATFIGWVQAIAGHASGHAPSVAAPRDPR